MAKWDTRIREALQRTGLVKREKTVPQIPTFTLRQEHVEGALCYGDRRDMVKALRCGENGVVAEVGVAFGDFSEFLLETLRPKKFCALDLFELDKIPEIWGAPSSETLKGLSHLEFYQRRLAKHSDVMDVRVGFSDRELDSYPDASFDLIYIDASHLYEDVLKDAEVASRKLKADGTIFFNDYVMNDPLHAGVPFGVVQTVNEMVVKGGWRVVGFSFNPMMFCDIAIKRLP